MVKLNAITERLLKNAYKNVPWLIWMMQESRLLLIFLPTILKDFIVLCFFLTPEDFLLNRISEKLTEREIKYDLAKKHRLEVNRAN